MNRHVKPLISRIAKPAVLMACGLILASASQAPGNGVLCLGTFIYAAEQIGRQCRPGEDVAFQDRIAGYADRFDEYIIRNTGGDPSVLEAFKDSQGVTSEDPANICGDDASNIYDAFKDADPEQLERTIDELLERDGPPAFGDCT